MKGCSVEGCHEDHDAKGYCHKHYNRWKRHGDPLVTKRAPNGSGWKSNGYTMNDKTREHRQIVETALGHPLPKGSAVHHADEDRSHNENSNLVACQSYGYHRIIHMRMDALKATGHANWIRCPFCHKYDDPKNMRKEKVRYVHSSCSSQTQMKRRKQRGISL
jgi:hypothetical protein